MVLDFHIKNTKAVIAVMATLCFFRFWLDFGIGGDNPLSATIMSKYANKKKLGAFLASVLATQEFEILAGDVFAIIMSASFKASLPAPAYKDIALGSTVDPADNVWQIILMFIAISATMTYNWRMTNPKTACYMS